MYTAGSAGGCDKCFLRSEGWRGSLSAISKTHQNAKDEKVKNEKLLFKKKWDIIDVCFAMQNFLYFHAELNSTSTFLMLLLSASF